MIEEQPRRKQRVPLSPTELYYFKELKKLKQVQKIERFKRGNLYRFINRANIVLVSVLTYSLLSILILNHWHKSYILRVQNTYGAYDVETGKQPIAELKLSLISGDQIVLKTHNLFELPKQHQLIYIGKDYIFDKVIKAKLSYNEQSFWTMKSYGCLTIGIFALCMGFFIYKVDKHLTVNGLMVTFGLLLLSTCYFLLV